MASSSVLTALKNYSTNFTNHQRLLIRRKQSFPEYYTLSRYKSSTASVAPTEAAVSEAEKFQKDPLDLTFDNTKEAYKSKTTLEICRALLVLKLASIDYLVENNQRLMQLGRKVLGPKLFKSVMRNTFYGQFVAGENETDIQPTIKRMHSFGVKSILDYSAEEDLSEEQAKQVEMNGCTSSASKAEKQGGDMKQYQPYAMFTDRRKHKIVARTYFYLNEAQCEKNMEIFLKCINAVAGTTEATGLAAIKMTALGRPQLLLQLSEVIAQTRKYFKNVAGTDAISHVTPEYFEHKLEDHKINTHQLEVQKWLENMDRDRKGLMNLFSWCGLVDMNYIISDLFKVPNIKTGKMEPIITALSEEEEEMFRNMMRRLHTIARVAREKDIRVMIDAEQSYFQPAISRITMELMRKYNKEKAIIFNTYQCYLKGAFNSLVLDLELAERQNIYFGAKLVRGAYMEHERLRAKEIGYEDPINPTYDATSEMYHKCLSEVMRQIVARQDRKMAVMVASHNEDTVRFTINKMKELGIEPEHKVICFGQLLGMCDHVSFPLGQSGYSVYKYVPYGPIDEVLPYLSRRAQENSGLLKKSGRERGLLWQELKRRVVGGELYHTPVGSYKPI